MNKSFMTNFLSVVIIGIGYISPVQPELIKSIICEHLGWLVVWGGIFGGLMGALFVFA